MSLRKVQFFRLLEPKKASKCDSLETKILFFQHCLFVSKHYDNLIMLVYLISSVISTLQIALGKPQKNKGLFFSGPAVF